MICLRSAPTGFALAALIAAAPATAVVKTAVYTDTLVSGIDRRGLFGPANTNLTGAGVVVRFVYDTKRGTRTITHNSDLVVGGTSYGVPTPLLDASVTINGIARHVAGSYIGAAEAGADPIAHIASFISHDALDYTSGDFGVTLALNEIIVTAFGTGGPRSLDANVSRGDPSGTFFFLDNPSGLPAVADAEGRFGTGHGTVTVTGGVPEPATWALMVAGFGLVGTLRRRARVAA